jgi:polyhydroxybutyrate depolymerase
MSDSFATRGGRSGRIVPMRATVRLLAVVLLSVASACSSSSPADPPSPDVTLDLDGRPFRLHVPAGYDEATEAPLVVLLHGYTSNGTEADDYFQLTGESDRRGFLYAVPEGTVNQEKHRFWNATPACCDFDRSGVDDSGYLRRLVDTVAGRYPVDPARVYFVGHSNGGFMALRMACDHADRVTAAVSLAGAATADAAQCKPKRPVSVLQIHGTSDRTILYEGGPSTRPYPSAAGTVELWRDLNGCADRADTSAPPLDLESVLDGPETTVTSYHEGCGAGTRAELWSIQDGSHAPALTERFGTSLVDFLLARKSPPR